MKFSESTVILVVEDVLILLVYQLVCSLLLVKISSRVSYAFSLRWFRETSRPYSRTSYRKEELKELISLVN